MPQNRLARLFDAMRKEDLSLAALMPGPNLRYLTGLSFHMMERPILGLFPLDAKPHFILPELEADKGRSSLLEAEIITYGEDQASRLAAFSEAESTLDMNAQRIGVESLRMRMFELKLLEAAAPHATIISGEVSFASLRLIKDQQEIDAMRRAVSIAQESLANTLPLIQLGMTERELASELVLQLMRAGSQGSIPFAPIVASGPNSALPHATPGDRRLQAGDALLFDWGAQVEGYVSDITRTFALGEATSTLASIHEHVLQANKAARAAVAPDASCSDIDAAARRVIAEAGYAEHFIHRTGHGIGLEGHEHPYISESNMQKIAPGMTFTIEPGIYLPGQCGVRIEDDVVVTEKGCESLTNMPRELQVIA
jgi:Xaa-Pro dipeptidase